MQLSGCSTADMPYGLTTPYGFEAQDRDIQHETNIETVTFKIKTETTKKLP